MMSLQSSLLGFAIFKPFQPMLRYKFGPIENVVLQTTAVATATMPLAAGKIVPIYTYTYILTCSCRIRWSNSCYGINDRK